MKYMMVTVRDRALDAFGRPFFVATLGQAIRVVEDECRRNAPENQMFMHPEDFSVFHLGSFEDSTGAFELITPPLFLMACGGKVPDGA